MATTQEQAKEVLDGLFTFVQKGAVLLQDQRTVGARSGLPVPSIGSSIAPNINLKPLPFTPEELDDTLAEVNDAIENANRAEQAAQRATAIMQAATALLPKLAALL
jgi:hypothetical protein